MRGQSSSEYFGSPFVPTITSLRISSGNFEPETSTGRWSYVLENSSHTINYISMELDKLEIRYVVHGHDHLTSSCPPASSPQMASPSALGGDAGVIMCVCSRWCAGSGQARTTWCEVTDTF